MLGMDAKNLRVEWRSIEVCLNRVFGYLAILGGLYRALATFEGITAATRAGVMPGL